MRCSGSRKPSLAVYVIYFLVASLNNAWNTTRADGKTR